MTQETPQHTPQPAPQPAPQPVPRAMPPGAAQHDDARRDDARRDALMRWIESHRDQFGLEPASLAPASSDASFRRYFRLTAHRLPEGRNTAIVMDAPPPQEDCRPFVKIAGLLSRSGVSVPAVYASDLDAGFLLLGDFGGTTYLSQLNADRAPTLYRDASRALIRFQRASVAGELPAYSREILLRELMLFPDWYIARHKGIELADKDRQILADGFDLIIRNNLAQPAVFVHRDYHSRNLMVLDDERNPGILDFQDALHGPITYDLVSMLKDAYIRWDEQQVIDWAIRYWEMARTAGLPVRADFGEFYRDFEWMGLQRHLKVLGIFARLYYRDGKSNYLNDLPLVLEYTLAALRRYVDLTPLARLVERIEG